MVFLALVVNASSSLSEISIISLPPFLQTLKTWSGSSTTIGLSVKYSRLEYLHFS